MNGKTKKLTAAGMLAGLAYAATAAGRVPLILFLKYDPKDIIVVTAGLVLGPCTACSVSLLVSLAEMFTVSDNGVLGFLANVISSCAFSCPSAWIYRKMRKLQGAAVGLFCGWACMDDDLELSGCAYLYGLSGGNGRKIDAPCVFAV